MDISSSLKSQSLRPLTTLIVPGSVAVGPFIPVAGSYIAKVSIFFDAHPYAFVTITIVLILSMGVILQDIGAWIEAEIWDRRLQKENETHLENWYSYLKLRLRDDLVGQRYLRKTVGKMKFELSMAPALILFLGGTLWLDLRTEIFSTIGRVIFIVVVLILTVYMIRESYDSARVLAKTRALILEAVAAEKLEERINRVTQPTTPTVSRATKTTRKRTSVE